MQKNCSLYENSDLVSFDLDENKILELVYEINSWHNCLDYLNKYKNTINKNTIVRIINYSWIAFYSTYKMNMDIIIDIYTFYLIQIGKSRERNDISKKIYDFIKKNNNKNVIAENIFKILKK